ncbi:MAG: putative transposase [Oleiphilaceae bacterium]|jgi:putative transposase
MMSYSVQDQFHNAKGNVESILFMDNESVMLNELDANGDEHRSLITKNDFEEKLVSQKYLPKLVEKPQIKLTNYQVRSRDDRLLYLRHLKELVEEGYHPTTRFAYDLLIQRVEVKHPITTVSKHLAHKTICRHWRTWRENEFREDSVASLCRSSKGASRLTPATEASINDHISRMFSKSLSNYKKGFYRDYVREAKKQGAINVAVHVASQRTYYRRLAELNEYHDAINAPNLGQAERNQRLLGLHRKIKTHFVLQRVECDAVHLNMCLIDDKTGKPTDPVKLYIAFDVYSRIPLAVVLGFDSENKEDVLNLLRHMFLSDSNLPTTGMPICLIMDNGPGFNNNLIQKTCERLNTSLIYAPSNQPAKKPFVEQFNNILRNEFFRSVKIETSDGDSTIGFNSYAGKRTSKNRTLDINLRKSADIKVSDFKKLLNNFLTEYIHKKHEQTKETPLSRWNASIQTTRQPQYIYEKIKNNFHVALDDFGGNTNKIQPNGSVQCNKQRYSSPASKQLYNRIKKIGDGNNTPKVQVFYDPWDARQVTIVSQIGGEHVEVIACHIEFGENEHPISFDEINEVSSKSHSILQDVHYKPNGDFVFQISGFVKKSNTRKSRSRKLSSFEANNKEGITLEERVINANKGHSRLKEATPANPTVKLSKKVVKPPSVVQKEKTVKVKNELEQAENLGEDILW